jgi:hypothetical protein
MALILSTKQGERRITEHGTRNRKDGGRIKEKVYKENR